MTRHRLDDSGSAVVEFTLVGILLLFLVAGVVQVALVLHVRNVVTADAAEGARYAASAGVDATAGGAYAEGFNAQAVGGAARDVTCSSAETAGAGGVPLVEVRCRGRIRLSLLPFDLGVGVDVTGRAVKEGR